MAVNERGDKTSVNKARDRCMVVARRIDTDRLITIIPLAFNLEAIFIERAAAVAVAQIIRVIILKCFGCHKLPLILFRHKARRQIL